MKKKVFYIDYGRRKNDGKQDSHLDWYIFNKQKRLLVSPNPLYVIFEMLRSKGKQCNTFDEIIYSDNIENKFRVDYGCRTLEFLKKFVEFRLLRSDAHGSG